MLRRPRRNRVSASVRGLVQETHLEVSHLVFPLFLLDGANIRSEVPSLPGIFRLSLDQILKEVEECMKLGLTSLVWKKWKSLAQLDHFTRKRRLYAFLARRGFDPDEIRSVLNRLGEQLDT